MSFLTLFLDNDNVFELDALQDAIDSSYLNAATVSIRVLDYDDLTEVVASQTLSYVSASDGKYRASVDEATFDSLTDGKAYLVEFLAVQSGLNYRRLVAAKAAYRKNT